MTGGTIDRLGLPARVALGMIPAFILTLCGGLLPSIDLDSGFADAMVRVSDTAYWGQMPFLALAAVLMLVSRPGMSRRRRGSESAIVIVAMLVALAGNSLLNENLVKPAIGVPRPNIVTLAEDGRLGPEVPDGDAFYAAGTKDERRLLLAKRLTASTTPELTDAVRAHWIHEAGYALPSGHTTTAMAFATLWLGLGLMWLRGWRKAVTTVVIPIWAVGVAYSRLLLGVHTAADIAVGALVGIGWGVLAAVAINRVTGGSPDESAAT